MPSDEGLPHGMLAELNAIADNRFSQDLNETQEMFKKEAMKLDVKPSSKAIEGVATAEIIALEGYRSKLIEQESKYCDLVIAARPDDARITATFEATVTKSGKPVLMFPRVMKTFNTDKILIGWNNSEQASRAVSLALPLLKKAKEVQIITSKEYIPSMSEMKKLQSYLNVHGVTTNVDIVETTRIPGQALLTYARDGKYDLIVAGAFGNKGLKELMLGGTTKYVLEHTDIPVFMSH